MGLKTDIAVTLSRRIVVTGQCLESRLLLRVVGVAGQGGDGVAGSDVLQLDAAREHPEQRRGLVDRQVGVRPAVGNDGDVLPAVEAEAGHHPADEVDAVAGQHAQVIADAVRRAGGEGDLDVPGGALAGPVLQVRDQLPVDPHLGRSGLIGHDDRVRQLPVGERDRQSGTDRPCRGADRRWEVQRGGEVRPQGGVPVPVGGVEVAGGVAFAAGVDPAPTVRGELRVEQRRDGLVRGGPFGVPAAEHRVHETIGGAGGTGVLDPPAEGCRVVRWGAVVGGTDENGCAVARQVAHVFVERAEGDVEPAFGALVREPGGNRLGRAQIRPEQHRQPGSVPVDLRGGLGHRRRSFLRRSRLRCRRRPAVDPHPFARTDENVEIVRLDGQGALGDQLVVQVIDQVEALQEHGQHQHGLLQRELPPDARPNSAAERLVGVRRNGGESIRGGVVGIELLRVRPPDLGIPVQGLDQNGDRGVCRNGVPATDHRVLEWLAGEGRCRRPQPQRFVQDLPDVGQPVQLLVRRGGGAAQHLLDLRLGPLQHCRVLQQEVDRKGQQARCGLVAGDEEGDALSPDVVVRQLLAGLPVDAGEHVTEQIGVVRGHALSAPVVDQPVDQVVHEYLVFLHLPARMDSQLGLNRQLIDTGLRFDELSNHGLHEGMRGVAIEGIEPVPEPAQRDGVQGQPRHVGRDVHLLARVQPAPLVDELLGDVHHLRQVITHRLLAERFHQNVVRPVPQRVVGFRSEQPGPSGSAPQIRQAAADLLVEPFSVTQFVDQLRAGDEEPRPTRSDQPEDRPVLLGHLRQAGQRIRSVDVERVAQQR